MRVSTTTIADPLLEQLRAGKLKATVSVPYGSFYGGNGSGNGNSIDMFRECVEATKHAFTVTDSEREMTDEEYRSLDYYEYIEMNKEDIMEDRLAARDEDDDDDDISIGLNTPPFDYSGTVTFVLVCRDEAQRKEAIEWLEMYNKRAEYEEEDVEQNRRVNRVEKDIKKYLELFNKLTKALPSDEIHKKEEYRSDFKYLKESIEDSLPYVKNVDVRSRLIKKFANE
jgi:hypothetical protein